MKLLHLFLTLTCVGGISVGQLLFKKAALAVPASPNIMSLLLNGWLFAALALYGLTTLLWVWILRTVPLGVAYPFMGLAFLFVPLLEYIFMKQAITTRTMVGGALILAGVACAGGRA